MFFLSVAVLKGWFDCAKKTAENFVITSVTSLFQRDSAIFLSLLDLIWNHCEDLVSNICLIAVEPGNCGRPFHCDTR